MIKRFLPVTIIIMLILVVYLSGFTCYLTVDHFAYVHQTTSHYAQAHPILGPLLFIGIYILYVSLALPGIFLVAIMGGGLFPQPLSTIYVVLAETIGGTILYFSARLAAGDFLKQRTAPFLHQMEKEFQENEISYLFFLRLNPVIPLWLVNIAPALFNIHYPTFLWTTLAGSAPGSFVFTQIGAGLTHLMNSHEFNFYTIFNNKVNIALVSLLLLALLPILIKKGRSS